MPIFAESEQKIFGDILFDVVNNTNVTRSSPGSKTRALAQAVSKKMGRMWKQFDTNMVLAFLDGADGKYLDFIGSMMGLPRLGEETAQVSLADQVVKFSVDVGNFGNINSGSSITLTAGRTLSTAPNNGGITYRLPFSVVLDRADSEAFVAVEASRSGESYNLGPNQLIYHDFTNYTDSVNDTLKVTNVSAITSGQSVESDTNYRFRIANQVLASEKANQTSVRLAALVVPGVSDIVLIPFNRGIGTFDLIVKAVTPSVSSSLLDAVAAAVSSDAAQGIVSRVIAPVEIGMSMQGTLTLREQVSSTEEDNLINAVTNNVRNYIDNLDIGEDFIVNETVERIMATSENIKNVGTANKPLDRVYIHRPTLLEDNKVRSTLLGDFDPEDDEKLLVETEFAGATPILFTVAS